jgi:nicotinamide mononucleotide (NMN) deamidase PncC
VFVGVYVRGEVTSHKLVLDGDPGEIVEAATEQALELLLQAMRGIADS